MAVPDPAATAIETPLPWHALAVEVRPESLSDSVAHLNNVEILRLVDRAAETHLERVGLSRERMASAGFMWFVVRHEIDYRAEAFGGDHLLVATWVTAWSRTTCTRRTRLLRPADRTIVADASSRWVQVDLASRRPIRVADRLLRLLPPIEEPPPGELTAIRSDGSLAAPSDPRR